MSRAASRPPRPARRRQGTLPDSDVTRDEPDWILLTESGAGLPRTTVVADAWQISANGTKDYVSPAGIRVAPALRLLAGLV
jgi:hypothetical protein